MVLPLPNLQEATKVAKALEQGSAYHLTIINQIKQVIASVKVLGTLEMDFLMLETDKITFLMMLSAQGKFFSVTALDREKANIGIARALISKTKKNMEICLIVSFNKD